MYCTVLSSCTVLSCTVLYCTVLSSCTALLCTVLYCTLLLYSTVMYCHYVHHCPVQHCTVLSPTILFSFCIVMLQYFNVLSSCFCGHYCTVLYCPLVLMYCPVLSSCPHVLSCTVLLFITALSCPLAWQPFLARLTAAILALAASGTWTWSGLAEASGHQETRVEAWARILPNSRFNQNL